MRVGLGSRSQADGAELARNTITWHVSTRRCSRNPPRVTRGYAYHVHYNVTRTSRNKSSTSSRMVPRRSLGKQERRPRRRQLEARSGRIRYTGVGRGDTLGENARRCELTTDCIHERRTRWIQTIRSSLVRPLESAKSSKPSSRRGRTSRQLRSAVWTKQGRHDISQWSEVMTLGRGSTSRPST